MGSRLRRRLYGLPIALRAIGIRGYERILGIEWLVITTHGRRTGRPHRVIVDVIGRNACGRTFFVSPANGWRSAWARNLQAHPAVAIEVGGRELRATARDATGEEGSAVLLRFVREHPRYARLVARLGAFDDVSGRPHEEARAYLRAIVVIALEVTRSAPA